MQEWGEKSVLEVGLLFGDQIMGLLSVSSTERPLHLDDVEKELMIAFASTAAIAIHNAHLYHQIEEQAIHDGLTGLADHLLVVPSDTTARIQEMHITLGQMLCGALEIELGLTA